MRFITALLLVLMAAYAASAATETRTTGPFKVSFDLNTTLNNSIQPQQTVKTPSSSVYQILFKTYNRTFAIVKIEEFNNLSDSTSETGKTITFLNLVNQGYDKNISFPDIVIDGRKGFYVTGRNANNVRMWQAYYWLDSKDCECGPVSIGKTEIGVVSIYPLNVTKNLITSLHVENINQTAKPKTLTFMPPKMS